MQANKLFDSAVLVVQKLENTLGIYTFINNKTLEYSPASIFFKEFNNIKRNNKEKLKMISDCIYDLVTLTYITHVCNFYRCSLSDLRDHVRSDLLVTLLLPFSKREEITKTVSKHSTALINYLELLEASDKGVIKALSYRCIRLFLVLEKIGCLSGASIMAEFITSQAFISGKVDTDVKQSIMDLNDAAKELKDLTKHYTRKDPVDYSDVVKQDDTDGDENIIDKKENEQNKDNKTSDVGKISSFS